VGTNWLRHLILLLLLLLLLIIRNVSGRGFAIQSLLIRRRLVLRIVLTDILCGSAQLVFGLVYHDIIIAMFILVGLEDVVVALMIRCLECSRDSLVRRLHSLDGIIIAKLMKVITLH
jgi:hypothetical protein